VTGPVPVEPRGAGGGLTPLQEAVARTALASAAGFEFALAGAGALIAHGLIARPTHDLDLFSPREGGAGQVLTAVRTALEHAGFDVTAEHAVGDRAEFARLTVRADGEEVRVDLGRDWRAHESVRLSIGPVLAVEDAVASKAAAMMGRGLPRDYLDVAAAMTRFTRAQLLTMTYARDPGLRPQDAASAATALDRLRDEDFAGYGLGPTEVAQLRQRFAAWPRHGSADPEAAAAYAAAGGAAGPSS
jgi:hypothetical protein